MQLKPVFAGFFAFLLKFFWDMPMGIMEELIMNILTKCISEIKWNHISEAEVHRVAWDRHLLLNEVRPMIWSQIKSTYWNHV